MSVISDLKVIDMRKINFSQKYEIVGNDKGTPGVALLISCFCVLVLALIIRKAIIHHIAEIKKGRLSSSELSAFQFIMFEFSISYKSLCFQKFYPLI
jgi:hypothetical protein